MTEKTIGYAVNILSNIGGGHQVSMSLNLPVGAAEADFNVELDKIVRVLDRQSARIRLPEMEAEIARLSAKIDGESQALDRADSDQSPRARSVAGKQERTALVEKINSDRDVLRVLELNYEITKKEAE